MNDMFRNRYQFRNRLFVGRLYLYVVSDLYSRTFELWTCFSFTERTLTQGLSLILLSLNRTRPEAHVTLFFSHKSENFWILIEINNWC